MIERRVPPKPVVCKVTETTVRLSPISPEDWDYEVDGPLYFGTLAGPSTILPLASFSEEFPITSAEIVVPSTIEPFYFGSPAGGAGFCNVSLPTFQVFAKTYPPPGPDEHYEYHFSQGSPSWQRRSGYTVFVQWQDDYNLNETVSARLVKTSTGQVLCSMVEPAIVRTITNTDSPPTCGEATPVHELSPPSDSLGWCSEPPVFGMLHVEGALGVCPDGTVDIFSNFPLELEATMWDDTPVLLEYVGRTPPESGRQYHYTYIQPRAQYPITFTTENLEYKTARAWLYPGPGCTEYLSAVLDTYTACPGEIITVTANHPLSAATWGLVDLPLTNTGGNTYEFTVPSEIDNPVRLRVKFHTEEAIDWPDAFQELIVPYSCFWDSEDELDVVLNPDQICPGGIIEASSNYPLVSATLQQGSINIPLTDLGGHIYQLTFPSSIAAAGNYPIIFTTNAEISETTAVRPVSVPESCFDEPPDECIPPLPDICISSLSEIHLEPVPVAEFPNCTSTLRLELYTPQNGWEVAKTGIVANTPYTVTTTVTTGLKARFISDDDTVGAEVEVTDFCCGGGGGDPDEQNPPATPAAPTVDPDCEDEEVIVTSPPFSTIPGAFTKHIELQRRTLPAGAWETVHVFDNATSWVDDNVQGGNKYEYRARACNAAGCSSWSNISTISLESQTLQIAITKPAPNATVSGRQVIEFTLTDPTADYDPCNPPEPLPSCIEDDTLDLQVTVNGVAVPDPKLISGTARNGTYRVAWDTKNHYNAPNQTLAVLARGTDCCFKRKEQQVSIQNTIHSGIGYVHIAWERQLPAGLQYKRGHVSMTQNPLHDQLYRQYWVLSAVGADVTTDFSTDDDHEAAFNALTRIALTRYNDHNGIENVGTSFTLEKGGKSLHWVQRWIPRQTIAYYSTGLDMVQKLRTIKDGETFVFATSATNAKAFRFEDDALTELADFSEHDAENAIDAAILGDKIYVVADVDRLILIDTDTTDETLDMTPRGEHRDAYAVETTFGTIIALFTGDGETVAYDMSFSSPRRLWTLDFEADVVYGIENGLILTSGTKYYATRSKSTAPTLMFTFPHNVTALDEYRVGLDDGSVWGINPATGLWHSEVGAAGQAVSAVGHWGDGTINIYGVSARGTTELLEYGETGWSSGRTIEAPDGLGTTIDSITALHEHNTSKPSGGDQQGVISSSQLLIGTGDNGVMAAISSSTLDASTGAMLVSKRGQVALTPFWDVIPINNKN